MNNAIENTKESRKKFLAPLVVLLLCVVSLTGAAYAYSSSVTVTNNTVTGDEYVLEVYNGTGQLISAPIELEALQLTHVTNIGNSNTVKVVAEEKTGYVYSGQLTLMDTTVTTSGNPFIYVDVSPATDPTWDVTSVTVGEAPNQVIGTGHLGYKITVELFKDNGGAKGAAYTPGEELTFTSNEVTLWYEVTVTASGDGITFANNTAKVDVGAVMDALEDKEFILTFTAQPTARA